MNTKILLILLIITSILLLGCSKDGKIYLDEKYYGSSEYIDVTEEEVEKNNGNYILFAYNSFCSFGVPCEEIFQDFMNQYNISILEIPFPDFKNTYLYKEVKYAPSIIIVSDKEVIAYLDANKDEDIDRYQDVEKFKEWLSEYIYLEKK